MANTLTQSKWVKPGQFEQELTQMDEGIVQHLPPGTSVMLNGHVETEVTLHAALQAWLTLFKAVDTAYQAYQAAVKARYDITVEARTYYKGLKAVIKQYFGTESSILASFGIAPDRPLQMTTQDKVVAAAKRQQTRQVRGTKSKKQLARITVVQPPVVHLASDGTLTSEPPVVRPPAGAPPAGEASKGPADGT